MAGMFFFVVSKANSNILCTPQITRSPTRNGMTVEIEYDTYVLPILIKKKFLELETSQRSHISSTFAISEHCQQPFYHSTKSIRTTMSLSPVYIGPDDGDVESASGYRPGGFHPMHLGDLIDNKRYKVVHKLGYGAYATIWLCRDTEEQTWRAIKIIAAEVSAEDGAELRICKLFEPLNLSPDEREIQTKHLAIPLRHFWLTGPNGRHLCLVLPVLGPNLTDCSLRFRYEEEPIKYICAQLPKALAFLHSKGICHGDFRPDNICQRAQGLEDLSEEDIIGVLGRPRVIPLSLEDHFDWDEDDEDQDEEDDSHAEDEEENSEEEAEDEEEEDEEEADPHSPRYRVSCARFDPYSAYVSKEIVIVDFGESFLASEPPESTGIPTEYTAPESHFNGKLGFGSDLWALGCTICELRNGCYPFNESQGLYGLCQAWEDLNGPLPERYRIAARETGDWDVPEDPDECLTIDDEDREEWLRTNMRRTGVPGRLHSMLLMENRYVVPLAEGEEQPPQKPPGPSTMGWMTCNANEKVVVAEMSKEEGMNFINLLKSIFAWYPEERIRLADIPSHAWFKVEGKIIEDGGSAIGVSVVKSAEATASEAKDGGLFPLQVMEVSAVPGTQQADGSEDKVIERHRLPSPSHLMARILRIFCG